MKTCYTCCNYYEMGCFGSYIMSCCKIYGSLDVNQRERHPDKTADTCNMYNIEPKINIMNKYKINKTLEPFIDF